MYMFIDICLCVQITRERGFCVRSYIYKLVYVCVNIYIYACILFCMYSIV